jgi:hypothetical protein
VTYNAALTTTTGITLTGTPYSTPANAFDNNDATVWGAANESRFAGDVHLDVDFGTTRTIYTYRTNIQSGAWKIQFSDDGSTFTDVVASLGATDTGEVPLPGPASHRYWRLVNTNSSAFGSWQVRTWELRQLSDPELDTGTVVIGGGVSAGGVAAEIAKWFGPTECIYPETDPCYWPTSQAGLVTDVGTLLSRLSSSLVTTLNNTSDNVATLLNRLSSSLVTTLNNTSDNVATLLNRASDVLAALGWDSGTGASAVRTAGGVTVLDRCDELSAQLTLIQTLLAGPAVFPGTGWAMTDETDWTGALAWDVEADLYVLSVDVIPERFGPSDVAGVAWYPRLLWWCELTGTLASERHFVDFASAILRDGNRRLGGLLLNADPTASGSVQAWTYTAP